MQLTQQINSVIGSSLRKLHSSYQDFHFCLVPYSSLTRSTRSTEYGTLVKHLLVRCRVLMERSLAESWQCSLYRRNAKANCLTGTTVHDRCNGKHTVHRHSPGTAPPNEGRSDTAIVTLLNDRFPGSARSRLR